MESVVKLEAQVQYSLEVTFCYWNFLFLCSIALMPILALLVISSSLQTTLLSRISSVGILHLTAFKVVARVMFLLVSVILFTGVGVCQSCGQGYVFTRVCDSIHRGVCLSACWDTTPPEADTSLGSRPPRKQTPSLESRHPQKTDTPGKQTPPGRQTTLPRKQTPAYGQWAASTHPTGMHSCSNLNSFS